MIKRSLFLHFFGPQVLVLLFSLGAVALYAWRSGWTAHRNERIQAMYAQAELVARLVFNADGTAKSSDEINQVCRSVRNEEGLRFTIIRPDGTVLADSDANSTNMESHATRPEIVEALKSGRGWSDRYSATVNSHLLYAARAIQRDGRTLAVVRVAARRDALYADLKLANRDVLLLIAATCVLAALLSSVLARRVVRSVDAMRAGVARIGAGELDYRLVIPTLPTLAELAQSINQTASHLQKQIRAVADERSLRERILASMTEGVIALDARQRVMGMNDAARRLLNLDDRAVIGTPIHALARRADLLALVDTAILSDKIEERELADIGGNDWAIWARATVLRDADGGRVGTLVVLSDLSRVRRLERVRQEFVANVSHELRTPITSIMGFVETLQDGAVRDPETADRFLKILRRQAGQLQSIVNDLLMLSRLETQSNGLEKEPSPLAGIVGDAIEICRARAKARQVDIRVNLPEGLQVVAHAGLLEQALINLIDNAVQYGGNGGRVDVAAEQLPEGAIRISVRDYGPGIAPEHIDRLFERFYRIDKGRSREMGGTGLGLAIVKHVALVHGGNVSITSEPGQGSVFSLWLPTTTNPA